MQIDTFLNMNSPILYFDKVVNYINDLSGCANEILPGRLVFVKENSGIYRRLKQDNLDKFEQLSCLGRPFDVLDTDYIFNISSTNVIKLDEFYQIGTWYIEENDDLLKRILTLPEYHGGILVVEKYNIDSYSQIFISTYSGAIYIRQKTHQTSGQWGSWNNANQVTDEYGSIFVSQKEKDKYYEQLKDKDKYTFSFSDFVKQRYNNDVNSLLTNGISTLNHLIKYDPSMVVYWDDNIFSDNLPAHIYIGILNENKELITSKTHRYNIKSNMSSTYGYKVSNLLSQSDFVRDDLYVAISVMEENNAANQRCSGTYFFNHIYLKMDNPLKKEKTNEYFYDEFGSVYSSYTKLYEAEKKIKEFPEYTFTHGDLETYYLKSGLITKVVGYSTLNHPYKYDPSMVLELVPGVFRGQNPYENNINNLLYIYFGELDENQNFIPKAVTDLRDEYFQSNNTPPIVNLRYFEYLINKNNITNPYIAFGSPMCNGEQGILNNVILKRNNPKCKLKKIQLISLTQPNKPYFIVKKDNSSSRIIKHYSDNGGWVEQNDGTMAYTSEYTASQGTIRGRLIQSGWKYLYANGLPIDVIFYDKNNQAMNVVGQERSIGSSPRVSPIGQRAINEENVNARLLDYEITDRYPTLIEIPEGAVRYKLAVYGIKGTKLAREFSTTALEYIPEVVAYSNSESLLRITKDIGQAIANARQLTNFTYPCEQVATRYFTLNSPTYATSSTAMYPKAKGFCYGFRPLNSMVSYYTYLSLMKFTHGYNGASQINVNTSYNYLYGFVCVSFISAVLGLPFYNGTEWWMQNFADKMEKIDAGTPVEIGDLILMVRYSKNAQNKPSLFTHIVLVSDVMYNKDTGEFTGYKCLECTNIWTRETSATNYIHTLSAADLERDPNAKINDWRIRLPLINIKKLADSYKFEIDKQLDPLSNIDNIKIPRCVNFAGDMTYIGPNPKTAPEERKLGRYWTDVTPSQYIYIDTSCKYLRVTKQAIGSQNENILGNIDLRTADSPGWNLIMKTSSGEYNRNFSHYYIINLNKVLAGTDNNNNNLLLDDFSKSNETISYLLCTKNFDQNGTEDLYMRTPQPGIYRFYCYDDKPNYDNPLSSDEHATFFIPYYPSIPRNNLVEETNDSGEHNIISVKLNGIHVVNGVLVDDNKSFDELWFRMMPKPINKIDGYPNGVPYANYINVNAVDLWDEDNQCFTVGNKYQYFIRAHFINKEFGGITYKFRSSDYSSIYYMPEESGDGEDIDVTPYNVTIISEISSYEMLKNDDDDFIEYTSSNNNFDITNHLIKIKIYNNDPAIAVQIHDDSMGSNTYNTVYCRKSEDEENAYIFNINVLLNSIIQIKYKNADESWDIEEDSTVIVNNNNIENP